MEALHEVIKNIPDRVGKGRAEQVGSTIRFALPAALLVAGHYGVGYPLTTRATLVGVCIFGSVMDKVCSREGSEMRLRSLAAGGAAALAVSSMMLLANPDRLPKAPVSFGQPQLSALTRGWLGNLIRDSMCNLIGGVTAEALYGAAIAGVSCTAGILATTLGGLELYNTQQSNSSQPQGRSLYHFILPLVAGLAYDLRPLTGFNTSATLALYSFPVIALFYNNGKEKGAEEGYGALVAGTSLALLPLSIAGAWSGPDWLSRGVHITSGIGQGILLAAMLSAFSQETA